MDADTHCFFLSAWNSDSSPRFHQGQFGNNQLDYFSYRPAYQARHQLDHSKLRDDSDQIFETFNLPISDKSAATTELEPIFDVLTQTAPMQGIATCAKPSVGFEIPRLDEQNAKTKVDFTLVRLVTEFVKNTGNRTSMHNGQITPADSPLDGSLPVEEGGPKCPKPKSDRDDCRTIIKLGSKVERPRKKRKLENNEQGEIKRKKFLQRNRIAADKCRQNKKKWIDDLQNKVHVLRANNMEKKAACEDMKKEILQLKSSILIHSRSCTDKDIAAWIKWEGVQAHSRQRSNDILLCLSPVLPNLPSPTSTALSTYNDNTRRYGEVIAVEDFPAAVVGQTSQDPQTGQQCI